MKRKLIGNTTKIVAFIFILFILLHRVYEVFSWKDTGGDYVSSMDNFYELERDTVDVLILGSSHSYCGVDICKMWDEQGIAAYNMSISGQDLASTYYNLKEAFKTQHPKVVFVETFYTVLHGYDYKGNLYRNTLTRRMSLDYFGAVKAMTDEKERKDIQAKWPIIHTRYRELAKEDFDTVRPVYLGYRCEMRSSYPGDIVCYDGDNTIPIEEEEEEWLIRIEELVNNNDAKLCYFLTPYVMDETHLFQHKYVEQRAESLGIPYLNFLKIGQDIGLNADEDYIDWGHLNHRGAMKIGSYLATYIKQNYEISDHRGDAKYALWDENSRVRDHEMRGYALRTTNDIYEYMRMIKELNSYTIVFASSGNYIAQDNSPAWTFADIDWMRENYYQSGVTICDKGEVVRSIIGVNGLVTYDAGKVDLEVVRAQNQDFIYVDGCSVLAVPNGLNLVVYDKVLGTIEDIVGFDAMNDYAIVRTTMAECKEKAER